MDAAPVFPYQSLHEAAPIQWSTAHFGGAWLVTRHADVEMVLRDPRFSAQRTGAWVTQLAKVRGELTQFQRLFARALLFLDAPDHPRIRRVLQAGFKPDLLHRLRPQIVSLVGELLDAVPAGGDFDFIDMVAKPLPARAIALLLGTQTLAHDACMDWSEDLAGFIGAAQPTAQQARLAQRSLVAMARHFEGLLQHRRQHPGDDLVSRLLQAQQTGGIRGDAELLAQCAMLLFAGYETTRHALGNGLHALLHHPAQWSLLQHQPERMPAAVQELLRFESPVQYTGRRVRTGLVLHGQHLRRGDLVLAMVGAANRDPARYTQPNRLDISRCEGGSLSFGCGAHSCIGAALTRMEMEQVFLQVHKRWPRLGLVEAQPHWINRPAYRGLQRLLVRPGEPD